MARGIDTITAENADVAPEACADWNAAIAVAGTCR